MTEKFIEYNCMGSRVFGVLIIPENPAPQGLLVIGRTGSDRLSVHLARGAAARGASVFRFDLRGRAENEGPTVTVEQTAEDIRCALNTFHAEVPELRDFALLGVSEGSAAALIYSVQDKRIAALILVNPWIRMGDVVAKKHLAQMFSRLRHLGFWMKIFRSEAGFTGALGSLKNLVSGLVKARIERTAVVEEVPLKDRVVQGLHTFPGPVCIILSGGDPATEVFLDVTKDRLEDLRHAARLAMHIVPDANHMFSRSDWRQQLIGWSADFVLTKPSA